VKKGILLSMLFVLVFACKRQPCAVVPPWRPYDESAELAANANHPSKKMQYKLIQSKLLDKNEIWKMVADQLCDFTEEKYLALKPFILEQDIPTLQANVKSGVLTYETLTQWYLYRIVRFENDRDKALNVLISINPNAVSEARKRDKNRSDADHPIYGMPILLKDNIGLEGLPTTAGAAALMDNRSPDAFITAAIKEKGGIILGKTNLSEWANYLCQDCPNGYSAIGGQTLNAYGRKKIDTGGSSSGSGAAMSANFAAAAVGTETSGSILSPSSKNSIVGLKPTVGLLSRSGIVPLSGTVDTPGPMTRNVTDNAILLSVLSGKDLSDPATKDHPGKLNYWENLSAGTLKGLRLGVIKSFLKDSIYKMTTEKIASLGGIIIEFEPEQVKFDDFGTMLSADMKTDLPDYLAKYAPRVALRTISDIIAFNRKDSLIRIPYGQARFTEMQAKNISQEELMQLRNRLHQDGVNYFEKPMVENHFDAILSIDNRSAGYAAAAQYPCLAIPMGYRQNSEPCSITIIARPFEEDKLLKMGYAFEKATRIRKMPVDYR
jgi:amidase